MSDLREVLQSIYDQRGRLTPADVVEEARPPKHPLHNRFDWDNEVAGDKWRRHQAHELIQSVKIVYRSSATGELRDVRAFHAIRHDEENRYVYEPVEGIAQDEFKTKVLLADMRRAWESLKRRYEHFDEFRTMVMDDLSDDAA